MYKKQRELGTKNMKVNKTSSLVHQRFLPSGDTKIKCSHHYNGEKSNRYIERTTVSVTVRRNGINIYTPGFGVTAGYKYLFPATGKYLIYKLWRQEVSLFCSQ